jgi:glycosyltransferase involved in cell wall biosynthesis
MRTLTRAAFSTSGRAKKQCLISVIHAFAEVLAEQPRARLTLCGTRVDAPYAELINSLGIQSQVGLTYVANQDQVGSLILRSRWLVLPSYHVGYPLTPLESFARARRVIVSALGSVPEMCGASPAGLLIPARDAAPLSSGMLHALAEPAPDYRRRQQEAPQCFERLGSSAATRSSFSLALATLANEISEEHPASSHAG